MDNVWLYEISGETPSKKNGQTFNATTKTMVKKESFRKWHERALWLLRCSARPYDPLEAAKITVTFRHADLRRRDGDGGLASIQDLLQDAGIIVDDCWTRIGTPEVRHEVAAKASVFIEVERIERIDWAKKLRAVLPKKPRKTRRPIKYNTNL